MTQLSTTSGAHPADSIVGTVLAVQANYYRVSLMNPEDYPSSHLLCTRRARLKKLGQRVAVGDRVCIEEPEWGSQRGAIAAVLPRHTFLSRPPVANVRQALIVCALRDPEPEPIQLSRFLVQASASQLAVQVCLNKCDLLSDSECEEWRHRLQEWGYAPLLVSAVTGMGLEQLRQACNGQISVVAGGSGAGKSSLLNALVPDLKLRTQPVSGRLRHGRHTTRHVELFALPDGGWIADSPGFNTLELDACSSASLLDHFPEVASLHDCQFADCTHTSEPGCSVRELAWERYEHYQQFLGEVMEREAKERDTASADPSVKFKTKRGSKVAEPRLASKYRQESRRSRRQQLQVMRGDIDVLMQSEEWAEE
ncbi:MAG: ribosome small subunit-dependent GTPase A [Cyanobacteria bacterium P01_G01_bin.4]